MPDQNQPATKQDVAEIRAEIAQLSEKLTEQMRDMQTEELRAFHNWARPADVKSRSHEERLTLLEERISENERGSPRLDRIERALGLQPPPPQQS
jgi:hypothetical protein